MAPAKKKQDLIRRSVELVGIEQLAERIDLPQPLIEAWIQGAAPMPDRALAKLAGVLTELADQR